MSSLHILQVILPDSLFECGSEMRPGQERNVFHTDGIEFPIVMPGDLENFCGILSKATALLALLSVGSSHRT